MTEPSTPAAVPSRVPVPTPSGFAARAAYWTYDVLGGLAALAAVPAWPWLAHRGYAHGIGERLGQLPDGAFAFTQAPIWLHCASVGETLAAAALVARLRDRCPERPLLVSTTTLAGRAVASDELRADVATLLPVDALRIVDRAVQRLRPRALLVMETELWPGLFRAAARAGTPAAIVSGRVSARAAARYRWAGPLFSAALGSVGALGMQTAADAERIIALGARPDRVRVTGSLKAMLRRELQAAPLEGLNGRRVVAAASTQPGEEEFVLQAFSALNGRYRDALLILAPRRPERFDATTALLTERRVRFARRTRTADAVPGDVQVLLLDTVGELPRFLPSAWAVFVGGTVAPLGGHNVLEPATYGRPVAFGPHTENVAGAAKALCAAAAAKVVRAPAELAEYWEALLADRAVADAAGARGGAVAAARAEALNHTWELIAPMLEGP